MNFLRLLESVRTPFLNTLLQFVTYFGEETLFLVTALIIFWCLDKKCGYYLLYISVFGAIVNQLLKLTFCVPRPWILDPDFTIVESARASATGYSFPSGHTQCAAGLFLGIARFLEKSSVTAVCIFLTLLVGFSRMYLGVHTPADVGVSLVVAILLVLLAHPAFNRAWHKPRWFLLLFGLLFTFGIMLVTCADFMPQPTNAIVEFSSAGIKIAYTMLGAALGLLVSIWLDAKYIRFDTHAVWWAQLLKTTLGLMLIIAVRTLTKTPLLALTGGHQVANGIRYFLMVITGATLWPLTFRWFSKLGSKAQITAVQ
ncbi:MAG: phosphatase PAP2 family protein [Clostridia bacterium]